MSRSYLVLLLLFSACISGHSVDAPTNQAVCAKVVEQNRKAGIKTNQCTFSDGTICYPLRDGRIVCGAN